MKNLFVFLSLPYNYQIDWNSNKELHPRIGVRGFLDPWECKQDKEILSQIDLAWDWNRIVEIPDYEGEALPDTVYVAIFCCGYYQGEYGGSSWDASKAFICEENAKKYIKDIDSKWERWWIAPAQRRR